MCWLRPCGSTVPGGKESAEHACMEEDYKQLPLPLPFPISRSIPATYLVSGISLIAFTVSSSILTPPSLNLSTIFHLCLA